MAKKRLNKKVALVGSLVFVAIVVVLILAILHFSRDPEKFIKDGDAAMKAAREATDEQVKAEYMARFNNASDSDKARMIAELQAQMTVVEDEDEVE